MATQTKTTRSNGTVTPSKQSVAAKKANGRQALPHSSVAERIARGKAARVEVPRSSHASFEPSPTRADPVELLELQARTRVPELVPIRYGRMLLSPFTFYRGAAMLMAQDLAATPRSGLSVQCCGDAHLSNFGLFASPERRLVFDLNDFDETLHGPWEWDVKRLAVSMLIAARDNNFSVKEQHRIVLETVKQYRVAMARFAGMGNLEVWYANLDVATLIEKYGSQFKHRIVKVTEKTAAKARTRGQAVCLRRACRGHARCDPRDRPWRQPTYSGRWLCRSDPRGSPARTDDGQPRRNRTSK
jgi:hypothetical protein